MLLDSNKLSVFCLSKRGRHFRSKRLIKFTKEERYMGVGEWGGGYKRRPAAKVTGGGNVGMASDLC